jgi:uroporphyrinogen decarboxylase
LTNLYAMLAEQPSLIHELSKRILEQNIEEIRWLAHAGGDAIYIDDAMTTSDMISPAHFEEFSLPYMRQMVREIHTLGHKAIIIYFGGIADRLDLIAAIGADGLSMETSMKNYVNDIGQIAQSIGRRVSLFGNVDPVGMLERAGDEELEAEMRRQARGGARARGYIACTGSPITPATPLSRVRRFLELGAADGSM